MGNCRDQKCLRCSLGVQPMQCRMFFFMLVAYSSCLHDGSCWTASWTSPDSRERRQKAHSPCGHSYAAVVHLKSSKKKSGSSVETILVNIMCGMVARDIVGDLLGCSRFWNAFRFSASSSTMDSKHSCCLLVRSRSGWCWVWWKRARNLTI